MAESNSYAVWAGANYPVQGDVRSGVQYGDAINQLTGTLITGDIPDPLTGTCRIIAYVVVNGRAVEGAKMVARVINKNSQINAPAAPSTLKDTSLSDANGYVDVLCYREDSFVQGDGVYTIELSHEGQILFTVKAKIPNQDTAYIWDLTPAQAA